MGHIKEPDGVDLVIGPSTITEKEKGLLSWVIQYYKRTGKMPTLKQIESRNELPKPVSRKSAITRVRAKAVK